MVRQNFSEDYMLEHVLSGEVALPAGDIPEPFVDADDIADVAVAALTDDGHVGQLYELTGPRLLTFAEAVEEIASAAGREIRYVPVSIEEHAAAAAEQGVPAEVVDLLTYLFTRSWTATTPTWRTASSVPSAGSRGTSGLRTRRRRHRRLERLMDGAIYILTLVTALGCGADGRRVLRVLGFVMKALRRLPPAQGIAAMQSINVTAITPAFMTALFGTAVACVAVAVSALFNLDEPYAVHLLVGSALYLVGTIALRSLITCRGTTHWPVSSRTPARPRLSGTVISPSGRRGTTSVALRRLLLRRAHDRAHRRLTHAPTGFSERPAERVGFEPAEGPEHLTVFETAPFNHSGTPPAEGPKANRRCPYLSAPRMLPSWSLHQATLRPSGSAAIPFSLVLIGSLS